MIDPAEYESPHFTFDGVYLQIHATDADGTQTPPPEREELNSKGERNWVLRPGDKECDAKALHWKKALGSILVEEFLAPNLEDPGKQEYLLQKFPPNYKFYVVKSGKNPREARSDAYLQGPKGKRFRSPREFSFHAAWLMDGMPQSTEDDNDEDNGGCTCKYCTGKSQGKLNARLKRRQARQKQRLQRALLDKTIHIDRQKNVMNRNAFRRSSRRYRSISRPRSAHSESEA